MLLPISSVNQTLPSVPVAMNVGTWPMPLGYSSIARRRMTADLVDVLLREPEVAVGKRAVMSQGWAFGVGTGTP